jgi:hypothetical protein
MTQTPSPLPPVTHFVRSRDSASLPTQNPVTSMGFWGSVAAIVTFGFAWLVRTHRLPAEIEEPVRDLSLDIIAGVVAGVIALWGRWRARQPLGATSERKAVVMKALLPFVLLFPLLFGGCVASQKPLDPAGNLATQVNLAESAFEATAIAVDTFADVYDLSPATRQKIHDAVDSARTLVENLRQDFLAGKLDAATVVRRIAEAVRGLERNRTATVATEPKARQLRAPPR